MTDRQKRSHTDRMTSPSSDSAGVGARHSKPKSPGVGGGYQRIYTIYKGPAGASKIAPPIDQRLLDLEQIGMSELWLKIANRIGFDNFMSTWRLLEEARDSFDSERIYVPKISKYFKFIRRQLIEIYKHQGLSAAQIADKLPPELSDISIGQIGKIMRDV